MEGPVKKVQDGPRHPSATPEKIGNSFLNLLAIKEDDEFEIQEVNHCINYSEITSLVYKEWKEYDKRKFKWKMEIKGPVNIVRIS